MSQEETLEKVRQVIIEGDDQASAQAVREALAQDADPLALLNDGLMAGAALVGKRFEEGLCFLPELLLTGRALKAAMAELEPSLRGVYAANPERGRQTGSVVLATVQTDIHDIGKNIVSSMLTASGFTVHDLGVDVPTRTILAKAQEVGTDIIACSALLTTSLPVMRDLMRTLEASGARGSYRVMVGGAAVTPAFAQEIGADGTAENAMKAVELARELMQSRYPGAGAA